jgi:hypothetical protein
MSDFSTHGRSSFLRYAKSVTDLLVSRTFAMYPGRMRAPKNDAAADLFGAVRSVEFFPGIVAFHTDEIDDVEASLISNGMTPPLSDFRYAGKRKATVLWPDPWRGGNRGVAGGKGLRFYLAKAKTRLR